jgi:hypothetical protein
MFYFIYFYCCLSSRIGHDFVHEQCYSKKDWFIIILTSSIQLCSVLRFKAPEWFSICWQIASHSYMSSYMAFSRKYRTVWYHLATSKVWYLTAFPFLNFRKNWLARFGICSFVKLVCSACCVLGVRCEFCVNNTLASGEVKKEKEEKAPPHQERPITNFQARRPPTPFVLQL